MPDTDHKRMLEMAAKAMGWPQAEFQDMRGWGEVRYGFSEAMWVPEIEEYWNPLTDGDDALRLAATLRLHILHNDPGEPVLWVSAVLNKRGIHGAAEFQDEGKRTESTRLSIVKCAAAIGEQKP